MPTLNDTRLQSAPSGQTSLAAGTAADQPPAAIPAARAHYVLFLLTLVTALNYFDRGIFGAVLQSIKTEMQLSDTAIGLVGGLAFVVFYSVLGVPIAHLADRYSRRNIIAIGLAFWSAMTALTGVAANVWQLGVTRFLMGAGEASGVAPSNSLLSDLYSKARRPLVLAIVYMGSTVGGSLAYLVGGLMDQRYGWRSAFYVAGVPGIIVAALLLLTVQEPARGASEGAKTSAQAGTLGESIRFLLTSRTYILLVVGGSIMGIGLYAMILWTAAFVMRVHHLDSGSAGAFVATSRLMSLPGYLLGGLLTDRLGCRDERWRAWVPGMSCILSGPATALFLLSNSRSASFLGLCLVSLLGAMHFGPVYALCMNVARLRMRAVSSALFLFFASMVGQVVGPLGVGYLNDTFTTMMGSSAIRYSMLLCAACSVIGGTLFCLSSRFLVQDTQRALES